MNSESEFQTKIVLCHTSFKALAILMMMLKILMMLILLLMMMMLLMMLILLLLLIMMMLMMLTNLMILMMLMLQMTPIRWVWNPQSQKFQDEGIYMLHEHVNGDFTRLSCCLDLIRK